MYILAKSHPGMVMTLDKVLKFLTSNPATGVAGGIMGHLHMVICKLKDVPQK